MTDQQADNLRRLKLEERNHSRLPARIREGGTRWIAVTSGKGGVGKSSLALNAAIILAEFKRKVLLVDADTNLANLDILLGVTPQYNLADVLVGDKSMREIVFEGAGGIHILPGSSGVLEMIELEAQVAGRLIESFTEIEKDYDVGIIDTGAGLSPQIVNYVSSSDVAVIITTREPTSITDAYAMIKSVSHRNPTLPIHLLVNMTRSEKEAFEVYESLKLVAQNYLAVKVDYLGWVPYDPNVATAVASQTPFTLLFPRCPAAAAMRSNMRKLITGVSQVPLGDGSRSMLSKLLGAAGGVE